MIVKSRFPSSDEPNLDSAGKLNIYRAVSIPNISAGRTNRGRIIGVTLPCANADGDRSRKTRSNIPDDE